MEEPSITIKLKFGCWWFRSKPTFLRYSIDSQQWQHSSPLRWEVNCDCFHWWRCVGHLNAIWKTNVQVQQQLPEAVTRHRPQIIFAEKGSHNVEQTTQMVPYFQHPPIKYQKMLRRVKEGASISTYKGLPASPQPWPFSRRNHPQNKIDVLAWVS